MICCGRVFFCLFVVLCDEIWMGIRPLSEGSKYRRGYQDARRCAVLCDLYPAGAAVLSDGQRVDQIKCDKLWFSEEVTDSFQ